MGNKKTGMIVNPCFFRPRSRFPDHPVLTPINKSAQIPELLHHLFMGPPKSEYPVTIVPKIFRATPIVRPNDFRHVIRFELETNLERPCPILTDPIKIHENFQ